MVSAVRKGDVYIVPIPGDNGETKQRRVIVLHGAPNPNNPTIVAGIFGCSETKRKAQQGEFARVETRDRDFRKLRLDNATTFHMEDIRLFDTTWLPFKSSPHAKCTDHDRMLSLSELLERRLLDPSPLQLLPSQASEDARHAADGYARQGGSQPTQSLVADAKDDVQD